MPYYSRLPAYDMHGLNTRDVAMNGVVAGFRPGHEKWATNGQMAAAGVNLIVTEAMCLADPRDVQPPEQFSVHVRELPAVLIPLSTPGCWIVTYYLQPHPDIEDQIDRGMLTLIPSA